MRNNMGPALLHLLESAFETAEERKAEALRFLENPQYVGGTTFFSKCGNARILYANADCLVDQDLGHVGYQIGFIVGDSLVYEQCEDHRSRHLLRVDIPDSVARSSIGRRLGALVDGLERMAGIWTGNEEISGIVTIKGQTYLVFRVEDINVKEYDGKTKT